jgi:DNA topoisomerase VI subunit B
MSLRGRSRPDKSDRSQPDPARNGQLGPGDLNGTASSRQRPAAKLERTTLTTSRRLDYCTEKNLSLETGHSRDERPLVITKELMDNGLDDCEEVGDAPAIRLTVNRSGINVADNGGGIPPETVAAVLDFSVRVSSREHYVSPTRGARGNALKSLFAIPFVVDGRSGRVEIIARGVRHRIEMKVDPIRQEPVITHHQDAAPGSTGTIFTVHWPELASSILANQKSRIVQMALAYTVLNPHLTLATDCFGVKAASLATDPAWRKWLPSNPTSPHWYTQERFERLVCGYLAHDEAKGRVRPVREVVAEFDGLTRSGKQKAVLDATGLTRQPLSALRNGRELDHARAARLLTAMKQATVPVKPQRLGCIGRDHLRKRFADFDCDLETFRYKREFGYEDGLPYVVEAAFAWMPGEDDTRELITGVNWSPAVRDPFRQLGAIGRSLSSYLAELRAAEDQPVVVVVHVAYPRVNYADRGKTQVIIAGQQTTTDGGYGR